MKRAEFKKLLSELENLTYKQKMELLEVINQLSKPDTALKSIGAPKECRHCKSKSYYKWGKDVNSA